MTSSRATPESVVVCRPRSLRRTELGGVGWYRYSNTESTRRNPNPKTHSVPLFTAVFVLVRGPSRWAPSMLWNGLWSPPSPETETEDDPRSGPRTPPLSSDPSEETPRCEVNPVRTPNRRRVVGPVSGCRGSGSTLPFRAPLGARRPGPERGSPRRRHRTPTPDRDPKQFRRPWSWKGALVLVGGGVESS